MDAKELEKLEPSRFDLGGFEKGKWLTFSKRMDDDKLFLMHEFKVSVPLSKDKEPSLQKKALRFLLKDDVVSEVWVPAYAGEDKKRE